MKYVKQAQYANLQLTDTRCFSFMAHNLKIKPNKSFTEHSGFTSSVPLRIHIKREIKEVRMMAAL